MRFDAGARQVPQEKRMPTRAHREKQIKVLLRLDAVLERTGIDAQTLREMIAAGSFPRATEAEGREVWSDQEVRAWCVTRGRPLPAKRQAALDRLIDVLAADAVSAYSRTSSAKRETQ
jgi:predicted DNA-binding transcriptional regulator AlpA